jgi:hypothetical protein
MRPVKNEARPFPSLVVENSLTRERPPVLRYKQYFTYAARNTNRSAVAWLSALITPWDIPRMRPTAISTSFTTTMSRIIRKKRPSVCSLDQFFELNEGTSLEEKLLITWARGGKKTQDVYSN